MGSHRPDRRPGRTRRQAGSTSNRAITHRRATTHPPGQYGPPQGPPPGYGQPPPYPPGPPKKRSAGLVVAIVVGVLVVLGGGAAAAFFVVGGDDSGGGDVSTSSPHETAEALAQAWKDRDLRAIESLMTDRFLEGAETDCNPDDISGSPGDPEITEESGDTATAVLSDGGVTYELELLNEDGEWLIDGIGGSSTTEPPDPGPEADASPAP